VTRGILIGLALALLLWRFGKAFREWTRAYHYDLPNGLRARSY
jgi:hypothetical protein